MADKDTSGSETGEAVEAGKKGKGKLIITMVAALLLVGGGGAGAFFLGVFGNGDEAAEAEQHTGQEDHAESNGESDHEAASAPEAKDSGEIGSLVFVDLPDVLVNLQSSGKRMRFLKMRVALEAPDQAVANSVKKLMPRIMDSFQMYLRALTIDEVSNPASLHRLKEELMARTNYAITPHRIDDVLVKELLVQ